MPLLKYEQEDRLTLVMNTSVVVKYWAVYQHALDGHGPIYVGYCPFEQLQRLTPANQNSDWLKLVAENQYKMLSVTVLAIADNEVDARNYAHELCVTMKPRCNRLGYLIKKHGRKIVGSNGVVYENQLDAARRLGVTQPTISNHLRDITPHVKGVILRYQTVMPTTPTEYNIPDMTGSRPRTLILEN